MLHKADSEFIPCSSYRQSNLKRLPCFLITENWITFHKKIPVLGQFGLTRNSSHYLCKLSLPNTPYNIRTALRFSRVHKLSNCYLWLVCPSIPPSTRNSLAANGWIFLKLCVGDFYWNVTKIKVWLRSDKNIRHCTYENKQVLYSWQWHL
jgi:hypothetical protein